LTLSVMMRSVRWDVERSG